MVPLIQVWAREKSLFYSCWKRKISPCGRNDRGDAERRKNVGAGFIRLWRIYARPRAGINPAPTHILHNTTVIAKKMTVNGEPL